MKNWPHGFRPPVKQRNRRGIEMAYTEHEKEVLRQAGLSHVVDAAERTVRPGELKMTTRVNEIGRTVTEFQGSKSVWMDQFKATPQLQLFLNNGSFSAQTSMEKKNSMISDLKKQGAMK
jgi:hypothetical protein